MVGPNSKYQSHHDLFITIVPSKTMQNLGVLFDQMLHFDSHISQTVKACFFQLRNVARIHASLSLYDTETCSARFYYLQTG